MVVAVHCGVHECRSIVARKLNRIRTFDMMNRMQTSEAENRFKTMLTSVGFDIQNPDPRIAWHTFKAFVQEPVNCAEDGVLFQCGVFNFTNQDLFYLDFVRQLTIGDENGEYDHMEQLHCEFTCQPNKQVRGLKTTFWAESFENLDEYFTAVEGLVEFQAAMSQQGWQCKVEQEEV